MVATNDTFPVTNNISPLPLRQLCYSGRNGGDGVKLGFGKKRKNKPEGETSTPAAQETPSHAPQLVVSAVSLLGGRTTQQDALDYRLLPDGTLAAAATSARALRSYAMTRWNRCSGLTSGCRYRWRPTGKPNAVPGVTNYCRWRWCCVLPETPGGWRWSSPERTPVATIFCGCW